LGVILAISSQTIDTILALWGPCSWESVAGSFSYKKCWFLGLKHTTPKYSQNKILAVKNLEKSLRTSAFGVFTHHLFLKGCIDPDYYEDGFCDDHNNYEACFFDGGDCCGSNVNTIFCTECECLDPNNGNTDALSKKTLKSVLFEYSQKSYFWI
jgi:hypothetical protein